MKLSLVFEGVEGVDVRGYHRDGGPVSPGADAIHRIIHSPETRGRANYLSPSGTGKFAEKFVWNFDLSGAVHADFARMVRVYRG